MICILVVWLYVKAGVSWSVANTILKALNHILFTTLSLIEVALSSSGINIELPHIRIPQDVRTAYNHHFTQPDIIRTACCPTCFSLYPLPGIPQKCTWKASPRSKPCDTDLWRIQNTRKGPKWVPCCMFSTQNFDSWLRSFLSRKVIVDNLTKIHRQSTSHIPVFAQDMHDIQDSPAWRDLHPGGLQSPFDLTFGIYVDWFNPLTNKISGEWYIFIYLLNF